MALKSETAVGDEDYERSTVVTHYIFFFPKNSPSFNMIVESIKI
jgi:hypothetical protein